MKNIELTEEIYYKLSLIELIGPLCLLRSC